MTRPLPEKSAPGGKGHEQFSENSVRHLVFFRHEQEVFLD